MSDDVLAITLPMAVVIIGAFLAYYFDSRKAREFSLIEKLWNLKREGYTEIELIQMQLSQLAVLLEEMHDVLRSGNAGLNKVEELISNVRLVENIHGVKTGVLEELLDLRKDFDQNPEAQMGTLLSEKLEPIVETVSHKIEDEFIGLSQRSAKIIHGLYLITDDGAMLDAAGDSLSNYYKLGDAIDNNSPDVESIRNECEEERLEFKIRARQELDRTRKGKSWRSKGFVETRASEPAGGPDPKGLNFQLAFIQIWIGAFIAFYLVGLVRPQINMMLWAVVSMIFGLLITELIFFGYSPERNTMRTTNFTGLILRHLPLSIVITCIAFTILVVVALVFRL